MMAARGPCSSVVACFQFWLGLSCLWGLRPRALSTWTKDLQCCQAGEQWLLVHPLLWSSPVAIFLFFRGSPVALDPVVMANGRQTWCCRNNKG